MIYGHPTSLLGCFYCLERLCRICIALVFTPSILGKIKILIIYFIFEINFLSPQIRFDDIFLGIVAHKAGIELVHNEEFHFYRKSYTGPASYRYVLASHGYDEPDEMVRIWSEVRANGYA